MEIEQKPNRPFVIRRNQNRTLLPPDSSVFDERVEGYVRFVQAANAFVIFFELYESIRVVYMHMVSLDQCTEYSHYLIALALLNFAWIIISLSGSSAISSKQSSRVTCYFIFLLLVGISRVAFYVVMEIKMSEVLTDLGCDFIYQGGLYIVTACLEGILILILIFLTCVIRNYISSWEESQKNMNSSQIHFDPHVL